MRSFRCGFGESSAMYRGVRDLARRGIPDKDADRTSPGTIIQVVAFSSAQFKSSREGATRWKASCFLYRCPVVVIALITNDDHARGRFFVRFHVSFIEAEESYFTGN